MRTHRLSYPTIYKNLPTILQLTSRQLGQVIARRMLWIKPGQSTIDLFGAGFCLLRFDPEINVIELEMQRGALVCRSGSDARQARYS